MAMRYEIDNKGMARLLMDDGVQKAALAAAADVVLVALKLAPEAAPGEKGASDGTTYRQHFSVEPTVVSLKRWGPRRSARVVNDASYAAAVEFGTGRGWRGSRKQGGNPGRPQRPLGRAGAVVGDYKNGPGS